MVHLRRWSVAGIRISQTWAIVWHPNKAIDIGKWSFCDGDKLEVVVYIGSNLVEGFGFENAMLSSDWVIYRDVRGVPWCSMAMEYCNVCSSCSLAEAVVVPAPV